MVLCPLRDGEIVVEFVRSCTTKTLGEYAEVEGDWEPYDEQDLFFIVMHPQFEYVQLGVHFSATIDQEFLRALRKTAQLNLLDIVCPSVGLTVSYDLTRFDPYLIA